MFQGFTYTLSIINCYGPYLHRDVFWNKDARGGLLALPNLILVGDLNLTLNTSEVWGSKAHLDLLGPFFTHLFADFNLVDVAPPCAGPSWRNGRSREDGIRKRLDHFFLSLNLIDLLPRHRVWYLLSMIFDHYPVLLEWKEDPTSSYLPFKFNHS